MVESGRLVDTKPAEIEKQVLADIGPNFVAAVEHEPIPFISYPYEWSFTMLQDAALLTLDVLKKLLRNKIDNYDDWEKAPFEGELGRNFEILETIELGSGSRFLYFARSKTP